MENRHSWNSEIEVCEMVGKIAAMVQAKDILEIGVFEGETSKELINNLPKGSRYWGVDIADYRTENVKKIFDNSRAEFILGKSIDVLKNFNTAKFDFVFVDGDHSWENVLPEFKAIERVLKPNGVIVYHDAIHLEAPRKITSYAKFYGYNVIFLNTPENRGLSIISKR